MTGLPLRLMTKLATRITIANPCDPIAAHCHELTIDVGQRDAQPTTGASRTLRVTVADDLDPVRVVHSVCTSRVCRATRARSRFEAAKQLEGLDFIDSISGGAEQRHRRRGVQVRGDIGVHTRHEAQPKTITPCGPRQA